MYYILMPRIIKLLIEKIKLPPSEFDIKEFSMLFSKSEWSKLTQERSFLNSVTIDLVLAKKISDEILNKI